MGESIVQNLVRNVAERQWDWTSREIGLVVLAGIVSTWFLSFIKHIASPGIKAPVSGYKGWWEPELLLRLRFSFTSKDVVYSGYKKFKDSMWKIVRNDRDIIVLPSRYLNELGNLTDDHSSSSAGQINNMAGKFSTADVILNGDVHFRMIQEVLTPNLTATIPMIKDELDYAMAHDIPKACDNEWVELSIFDLLSVMIARVAMRVFVGPELCRNEGWIKASLDYDINVGTTVIMLRMFPPFLHPFLARFMPSWYRAHGNIRAAEKIIGPEIRKRQEAMARGDYDIDEPPRDLMQWILEAANKKEADPDMMSLRMLVVGLAALHTTSMAMSHAMYDLCQHPEYFEPLRNEMLQVLREDGGWQKQTIHKLKLLDSFVKETQRWSPASLMSFNRYLRKPVTLSDGTHLPKGTHICFAADPIQMDPQNIPGNPQEFDGFRFARKREDTSDPNNANRFQLASVDRTSLHFGAGRYGCPGRFFASAVIKIMFSHILLHYDFKYPEGKSRPKNMYADENIFPDPTATLLMRKREKLEPDLETILAVGGDLEHWSF